MRLVAIPKATKEILEIAGVHEIVEKDGTYYISGEYDPASITSKPLTIIYDGSIRFKAYKLELDDRLYYSIEVSK